MIKSHKEQLNNLSKEQLIYLIEQLNDSMYFIGESCVDESKRHINSEDAIDKIRKHIYYVPSMYRTEDLKAYLDMKMGKISELDYRKIIGLED